MRARTVLALSAALVIGPIAARAQTAKATASDSIVVANNAYAALFNGITLPPENEKKAISIIRKAFLAKVALHGEYEEILPQLRAITAQRDSALKALIPTAADKQKFERRAAARAP